MDTASEYINPASLPLSNRSPHHSLPSTPITMPSKLVVHTAPKFSEHELDALDALRIGLRISQAELDNLFEQCDHCSQSFMWSALRIHIKDVEANQEGDSQTSDLDTNEDIE